MHQIPNKELLPRYHKIPVQRFLFSLTSQLPTNKLHVAAQAVRKEILSNRTLNVQTFTPATTVTEVLKQGRAHLCPRRHYSKPPSLKLTAPYIYKKRKESVFDTKLNYLTSRWSYSIPSGPPPGLTKQNAFGIVGSAAWSSRPPVPTHLKECKTLDWKKTGSS